MKKFNMEFELLQRYMDGIKSKQLAKEFKINLETVYNIVRNFNRFMKEQIVSEPKQP